MPSQHNFIVLLIVLCITNYIIFFVVLGMFDRDHSGTINFEEFKSLWKYITDWLNCFRSFDTDHSGNIDRHELKNALTSFGKFTRH